MADEVKKSETARREEEVLALWKERGIFEKSLAKDAPEGEFVFYDGPPFATGLPHTGSLLSSIIKDVVPRYKTMRGFHVRRRWGWDCHGLPIESLIEKRFGLTTKKDIEKIGIAAFNKAARESVLGFEKEWERYVERVGRWVDFKNSYKTMDNSYIESVWWGLKRLWEKGLLYEGRKVLMYCTHCETPLAKAEIAMDNTYKDVTEEAVTVEFRIKGKEGTSLLAWTTTPWTLPGNVALAVNPDVAYVTVEKRDEGTGPLVRFTLAKSRLDAHFPLGDYSIVEEVKGSLLVGLEYEPLFDVSALKSEKSYKVYAADFVTTGEGTGIVHTAVMYGEDDFKLGEKEGLPMVQLLSPAGTYLDLAPESLRGKYIKQAEKDIKRDLESRGLLFEKKNHTHSYPHCYRCGTPLIYNAVSSWFVNIQKIKGKMLAENERVIWVPEHLQHGRFGNIVKDAPDWTISRNRFWASPLPIWKERGGERVMVVGSLEELRAKAKRSGNTYLLLRHGEAESNIHNVYSSKETDTNPLTDEGRAEAEKAAETLARRGGVDLLVASPFARTRDTAEIVRKTLGLPESAVYFDERLREVDYGIMDGEPRVERRGDEDAPLTFEHAPEGGETLRDVRRRMGEVLVELEKTHRGKRILIVSHGGPLWVMRAFSLGLSEKDALAKKRELYPATGEVLPLDYAPLPLNERCELDLHRPYTDSLVLLDESGREYERIPEVVDCWVESGSMPFAERRYPFSGDPSFEPEKTLSNFGKRKGYPADFIAEYIAQTRTWFYYMHAVGVALFGRTSFKTVVSTGTILAADGSKMSKSKGNYTDPYTLMETYGADALRWSLLSSVIMQSEDLNFKDEDVREAANRIVGMLWNCYKFYELYAPDEGAPSDPRKSAHVLDRWILSRLSETIRGATSAMDAYDTPKYCRSVRLFLEDYSTWYVRRSRERVKGENSDDKRHTLATQRLVLETVAKCIAPVLPFLAESVYRGVGGEKESVHLEAWPDAKSYACDTDLIRAMGAARDLVSSALEAREAARIKIRQPLSTLFAPKDILPQGEDAAVLRLVVAEEVNVREVREGSAVSLDTNITPELREEGFVRELIRAIQSARKEAGMSPLETADVTLDTDARAVVEKRAEDIRRAVSASALEFGPVEEKVQLGEYSVGIRVSKPEAQSS